MAGIVDKVFTCGLRHSCEGHMFSAVIGVIIIKRISCFDTPGLIGRHVAQGGGVVEVRAETVQRGAEGEAVRFVPLYAAPGVAHLVRPFGVLVPKPRHVVCDESPGVVPLFDKTVVILAEAGQLLVPHLGAVQLVRVAQPWLLLALEFLLVFASGNIWSIRGPRTEKRRFDCLASKRCLSIRWIRHAWVHLVTLWICPWVETCLCNADTGWARCEPARLVIQVGVVRREGDWFDVVIMGEP